MKKRLPSKDREMLYILFNNLNILATRAKIAESHIYQVPSGLQGEVTEEGINAADEAATDLIPYSEFIISHTYAILEKVCQTYASKGYRIPRRIRKVIERG